MSANHTASRLSQVRGSGQKIAAAMASVLGVEVEIIDTHLVRVAATGSVRSQVGSRLKHGFVNKYVLEHGQPVFINQAGHHAICAACPLQGDCFYRASIVYPIRAAEAVIGTISLTAFDEGQRERLTTNTENLQEFIGHMADLIGSKVLEIESFAEKSKVAGQLAAVVDAVYEGLVAVDREGVITHFNSSAERIFKLPKEKALGRPLKQVLTGVPLLEVLQDGRGFSSREVFVNAGGRRFHLLSTARSIRGENNLVLGAVASFRDFQEAQKLAYEYISAGQVITLDQIIGVSPAMQRVKAQAEKIAHGNSTVLILGETGTGKEIFARAIHAESPFAGKPFVAINCGAIPESLLESELFGYEEGAFTGARRGGKPGKFELADGGTIFLDEIGNMSLYLQAKLLRVLQERQVERVGGTRLIPVNIRVIAATNADLQEMVQKGTFREDLYYRVSVIPLVLPPLRERQEDIPLLLMYYMKRFADLLHKDVRGFTDEAMRACVSYHWPGNVRELINVVEYAVNIEDAELVSLSSLPARLWQKDEAVFRETVEKTPEENLSGQPAGGSAEEHGAIVPLEEMEKVAIQRALQRFGWHEEGKRQAAAALGISRATIYRKIEKYRLRPEN
ncbi:MAG: sigma-54-dependent Fis family transcriptional regulator [Desulfurispora sp.]|uniref:sigma-54-dependent Fis family transcriptional regulator n=1 Tax=Desulfurispora sp. TaxID=3014275 RepID=UPI00404AB094